MPLLNEADKVYFGADLADAAYLGETKVWSAELPPSIPGLTAWVDASKQPDADGARVYTVLDHSPAKRSFAWPAGNEPMMRKAIGASGKPALDWISGYCYGMDGGLWNPGTVGLTYFFVGTITGGTYPMMCVWGPDADGIEMRHEGTSLQIVLRYAYHGIYWTHGSPSAGGVDHLWALRVGLNPTKAWSDQTISTGPVPQMPNTPLPLYIGRRQGGYPFVGYMREALVYAGPLSDADMDQVFNYLQEKWHLGPVPKMIPGLKLWLDASSLALTDGAQVANWTDLSASGFNATSVESTRNPVFKTAMTPSGKPAVQFSLGPEKSLDIRGLGTWLSGRTTYSMVVVARPANYTNYPILLTAPTTTVWQWLLEYHVNGAMYVGHQNGYYRLHNQIVGFPANQLHRAMFIQPAGASPSFYMNGVIQNTYQIGPSGDIKFTVPTGLGADVRMGAYWDRATAPLQGDIAEILFYDHALTTTEQNEIEAYLKTKWGLT